MRRLTIGILLSAVLHILWSPVFAQEFWSHKIGVQVDVPYGSDSAQVADVYTIGQRLGVRPFFEPDAEPRPTLMWIHAGGWFMGDKSTQFPNVLHYLERGWHVVNINFRQGRDTAPQAIDDSMCAYKWVVDRALKSGQSSRFVVSGGSSGGHLALMVGLINSAQSHPCKAEIAPSAVVNWSGVTNLQSTSIFLTENYPPGRNFVTRWVGDQNNVPDFLAKYSPKSLISESTPPIITIHGTEDAFTPYVDAEIFHSALSTRNRLVTLDGADHNGFSDAQRQEAMTAVFEFLEEHLAN